jgi:transcriptional regulator with XRE-family HTH domain
MCHPIAGKPAPTSFLFVRNNRQPAHFDHHPSNLLSNTGKRDLIAAFHGSGTREQRDPRDLRVTRHPPPSPLLHKAVMDTGSRLKLVRESYKLSQRELARRSGVTNATISLIEQNRVSPSVSSLKKLLEGIPMSLADFFTFDQPPREHQYVFRANEQPDLGRHGLRLLLIGASVPSRQMRLLREQYAPGASSGEEPIVHAEGEECGLVTRGTVELTVDGQVSVLSAGDGYYFPTTLPHKFRNIGADEAEIISANTPANF